MPTSGEKHGPQFTYTQHGSTPGCLSVVSLGGGVQAVDTTNEKSFVIESPADFCKPLLAKVLFEHFHQQPVCGYEIKYIIFSFKKKLEKPFYQTFIQT